MFYLIIKLINQKVSSHDHKQILPKRNEKGLHSRKLVDIIQKGGFIRISENYISDVTSNYFIYSDSRKVPRIRAGLLN